MASFMLQIFSEGCLSVRLSHTLGMKQSRDSMLWFHSIYRLIRLCGNNNSTQLIDRRIE